MKTNFKTLGVLLVLMISPFLFPKTTMGQQDYVSLQVFYDELSPYGQWIDYPRYGYVWMPDAGADFMPYSTRGQWIYTDYGWTWVSDYEWGWAPFHYGRWDYDNYYGWIWVPDYEWGPSWVTWRRASGYYGWQPMRPGISISFSFGNDYYNSYNDHWMFVRDRDFQRSNVSRYYVNQSSRERIIRNSTVINNTYIDNSRNTTYISGPAREDVQRSTGRRVYSTAIQENTRPGQDLSNGQLRIYRPQVRNTNVQGHKPAPNRITNIEEVRRPSGRNTTNQQRGVNPSENYRRERQPNNNRIEQPMQQRNENPSYNNEVERQRNNNRKQNDTRIEQPMQQRNENPSYNSKVERQRNNVREQNKNRSEQPLQLRNENPSPNNRSEQPQNRGIQQTNDNNVVQPNVNPSENKKEKSQQEIMSPPNNNMKTQPLTPNLQQPEPAKQELQQKAVTPQNAKRNRQIKEAKEKNDKRRNN